MQASGDWTNLPTAILAGLGTMLLVAAVVAGLV
jgi:hypothetical protein